ncbi:helix-turn-helix domain-containing protein [Paracoccus pantotrophus]|uniref:helix-turn-helix domain-containing protein n=1 Tax=Paracoccus pantotrophus TaxID=82367 RepID=UPI00055A52D4|nr:helix-turn-helix domain-containing protein [Paracoccus pantotrophus]
MTSNLPARIDDLPTSLVELAETLGMRVAVALIENFGGLELKLPARPRPDHPVIKALGEEDGYALFAYMGGGSMYVPHNRTTSARADILKLEAEGKDRAEIARILGISQRHVRRMANRREDPRQSRLFD